MAALAYCANCRSNFTDPDDVAAIVSSENHMCRGCDAVRGADGPHENLSSFQPAMPPVAFNAVPVEAVTQRNAPVSELPAVDYGVKPDPGSPGLDDGRVIPHDPTTVDDTAPKSGLSKVVDKFNPFSKHEDDTTLHSGDTLEVTKSDGAA